MFGRDEIEVDVDVGVVASVSARRPHREQRAPICWPTKRAPTLDAVADLAQPGTRRRATRRTRRARSSTITAPAGPSPARSGAPDERADDTARVLEVVRATGGVAVADVHESDHREPGEREPDAEAPTAARPRFVLLVFVVGR